MNITITIVELNGYWESPDIWIEKEDALSYAQTRIKDHDRSTHQWTMRIHILGVEGDIPVDRIQTEVQHPSCVVLSSPHLPSATPEDCKGGCDGTCGDSYDG